jgi:PadR family transcriptional regulator PadR
VDDSEEVGQVRSCDLRNFLPVCLLLLLDEAPDHGYDLVERLRPLIPMDGYPGGVYRVLRHLEEDGLVSSSWQHSHGGPLRRRYDVTPLGQQTLRRWALDLRALRDSLDRFLLRYGTTAAVVLPSPATASART